MRAVRQSYTVNIYGAEWEIEAITPADAVDEAVKLAFDAGTLNSTDKIVFAEVWKTDDDRDDEGYFDTQVYRVDVKCTIKLQVELEETNHGC